MEINFACKRFEIDDIIRCSLGLSKSDLKILNFLMKYSDKSLTSSDISKKLNLDVSTVQRGIKGLYGKEIVNRKQFNLKNGGYTYVYQIKNKQDIKKRILKIINIWVKQAESEIQSL
jgi:predicted transcriptional regulator